MGGRTKIKKPFKGSSCRVGPLSAVESNGERGVREDLQGSRCGAWVSTGCCGAFGT